MKVIMKREMSEQLIYILVPLVSAKYSWKVQCLSMCRDTYGKINRLPLDQQSKFSILVSMYIKKSTLKRGSFGTSLILYSLQLYLQIITNCAPEAIKKEISLLLYINK